MLFIYILSIPKPFFYLVPNISLLGTYNSFPLMLYIYYIYYLYMQSMPIYNTLGTLG